MIKYIQKLKREVIKMVKCPHCGSSAQVKLSPTARLSDNQAYLTLGAECGCGCNFTADYYVPEPQWINIEYIERKEDK